MVFAFFQWTGSLNFNQHIEKSAYKEEYHVLEKKLAALSEDV
jgi:hypothetical protein